jgi:hypothetical protein
MFTLNLKGACPMSPLVYRMNAVLSRVVQRVPVGTNLGLFHCLWMLLSGRLLLSRGAVIPGLAALGLGAEAVRRAWAALAYGKWHAAQLLEAWEQLVREEQVFHAHQYGGYRPVACDLVGFFRPRLQDCPTKHYASAAGKALPAIPLGSAARVGTVGTQRLAVPCLLVRGEPTNTSETDLQLRLLQRTNAQLAADEALVCDRGVPLRPLQAAGVQRYVVRAPINFTARRAALPEYQGKGRKPTRGALGRPLPRTDKGRTIAATPPDRHETWQLRLGPTSLALHAAFWDELVCADAQPGAPTFSTVLIQDPRFDEPLLLHTSRPLTGADLQAFYRDRWPVEGLPLTATQMLGAARQFVFTPESRQRLPDLALVAGAILMYVAATQPALPTGFWDRAPKPTSGRLRRLLATVHCGDLEGLPKQLRKKPSPTAHLPKGVLGHRRQRQGKAVRYDMPLAA